MKNKYFHTKIKMLINLKRGEETRRRKKYVRILQRLMIIKSDMTLIY